MLTHSYTFFECINNKCPAFAVKLIDMTIILVVECTVNCFIASGRNVL